jgi:hypothetical protein
VAWVVSFQSAAFNYDDPGWSGFTIRVAIHAADIVYGGSSLRLTLKAASGAGMTIGKVYVGVRSGSYGFASAPVQALFGGSAGVSVAANNSVVSDACLLTFAETDDLLVSIYFSGSATIGGIAGPPDNTWYESGDDAATQSPTGYSAYFLNRAAVFTIEVVSSEVADLSPAGGAATSSPLAAAGVEARGITAAAGAATGEAFAADLLGVAGSDAAQGASTSGGLGATAVTSSSLSPAGGAAASGLLETVEGAATSIAAAGSSTSGVLVATLMQSQSPAFWIVPVQPIFVDVYRWADETVGLLYDVAAVPRLDAPGEWLPWAREIVGTPAIAAFNPPDPDRYADWRAWAVEFNEAISSRSRTV